MSFVTAVRNLWALGRTEGLSSVARSVRHRASERYYERYFGVSTEAEVLSGELGFTDDNCRHYAATDYASLFAVLKMTKPTPDDAFLDYGCGKGRAVLAAATFPFRRVIGLDLSVPLIAEARTNLERAKKRFRARTTEVVVAPADTYQVPSDITFAYFCNPFAGEILRQTLQRLRESLHAAPRNLRLLCRWPERCAFEEDIQREPDLDLIWSRDFSPQIRWRIYRFRR